MEGNVNNEEKRERRIKITLQNEIQRDSYKNDGRLYSFCHCNLDKS